MEVSYIQDQGTVRSRLMDCSRGHPNDPLLAGIVSSWHSGQGALPNWLGLGRESFIDMLNFHFPGFRPDELSNPGWEPEAVRTDERDELLRLLTGDLADDSEPETWMAGIVVNACQGQDHLWQDLGLDSRKGLSELMRLNFPQLAQRNDRDMKWKKFLYKQLCIAEGIYTCRAPSCEVCSDYQVCFGPED